MVTSSVPLSVNSLSILLVFSVICSSLFSHPKQNSVHANEKITVTSEQPMAVDEKDEGTLLDFVFGEKEENDEQILNYSYHTTQSDVTDFTGEPVTDGRAGEDINDGANIEDPYRDYDPSWYGHIDPSPFCLSSPDHGPSYCPSDSSAEITEEYASWYERTVNTFTNAARIAPAQFTKTYTNNKGYGCQIPYETVKEKDDDSNRMISYQSSSLLPMRYSSRIHQAAKQQSRFLGSSGCPFSHDTCGRYCSLYGGCDVPSRVNSYAPSWGRMAENIASSKIDKGVHIPLKLWLKSSGHCYNIMRSEYNNFATGLSITNGKGYWTQVFQQSSVQYTNYNNMKQKINDDINANEVTQYLDTMEEKKDIVDNRDTINIALTNPFYDGTHYEPPESPNKIRFLASFYYESRPSSPYFIKIIINEKHEFDLTLHMGAPSKGVYAVDLVKSELSSLLGSPIDGGCFSYYFLARTQHDGKFYSFPEQGSFLTYDLNSCRKNYSPKYGYATMEPGTIDPNAHGGEEIEEARPIYTIRPTPEPSRAPDITSSPTLYPTVTAPIEDEEHLKHPAVINMKKTINSDLEDKEQHYHLTVPAHAKFNLLVTIDATLVSEKQEDQDYLDVHVKDERSGQLYYPIPKSLISSITEEETLRINEGDKINNHHLRSLAFTSEDKDIQPRNPLNDVHFDFIIPAREKTDTTVYTISIEYMRSNRIRANYDLSVEGTFYSGAWYCQNPDHGTRNHHKRELQFCFDECVTPNPKFNKNPQCCDMETGELCLSDSWVNINENAIIFESEDKNNLAKYSCGPFWERQDCKGEQYDSAFFIDWEEEISKTPKPTPQPTPNPTNQKTPRPTPRPSPSPTPQPSISMTPEPTNSTPVPPPQPPAPSPPPTDDDTAVIKIGGQDMLDTMPYCATVMDKELPSQGGQNSYCGVVPGKNKGMPLGNGFPSWSSYNTYLQDYYSSYMTWEDAYSSYNDRIAHVLTNMARMDPSSFRSLYLEKEYACSGSLGPQKPPFFWDSQAHQAALKQSAMISSRSAPDNCPFSHNTCSTYCHLYGDNCGVYARLNAYQPNWYAFGENICYLSASYGALGALKLWFNSKGHCDGIMNDRFTHMGNAGSLAIDPQNRYGYWTQVFYQLGNVPEILIETAHLPLGNGLVRFFTNYYNSNDANAGNQREKVSLQIILVDLSAGSGTVQSHSMTLHLGTSNWGTYSVDIEQSSDNCYGYYTLVRDISDNSVISRVPKVGAYTLTLESLSNHRDVSLSSCNHNYFNGQIISDGGESEGGSEDTPSEQPTENPNLRTPKPTPRPTPKPTPRPTPRPTPQPTTAPAPAPPPCTGWWCGW